MGMDVPSEEVHPQCRPWDMVPLLYHQSLSGNASQG